MIHVIWNEKQAVHRWNQGRDEYTPYLFEILKQSGFAYTVWSPEAWLNSRPQGVSIVAGLDPRADWSGIFEDYCRSGNALLTIGDTHSLDAALGVKRVRSIKEGWIDWSGSALADGLRSSFHFFGGTLVKAEEGVETEGAVTLSNGSPTSHPAVTFKAYPGGAAALLSVDLARTFCLIQQGISVVKDGVPSPDGSGLINDDIWKADDGSVLDWVRDRNALEAGGIPFYMHPIVDEFRLLFIRLLHRLSKTVSRTMAQVWFWPEGLEAVGHISHDTDGNAPEAAEVMLDRLKEAGIKSSWCIIMPGYPEALYKRIVAEGHEMALHYNALESEGCYWDEELFNEQLAALQSQMAAIGGPAHIKTNKNHYLRWEGDVQFYKWCERAGIVFEQSKGGTKQGNKGFLAGTCHPYLPMSDSADRNRIMKVYSNPTLAWDPPVPIRCTMPEAKVLLDRSKEVYGVAHFLYHPATMAAHDNVGSGFLELLRYGEEQGLVWWTALELYNWLELRRTVQATVEDGYLRITAERVCKGLTVLLPPDAALPEGGGAAVIRSERMVNRCGMPLRQLILDVPQGVTSIPLREASAAAV
ncbi:hypothetical protein [Paenibacillus ginsengarvi]|uniref:NodB homology domain-containing protein n=1 Tax=Paenibacillus ginsengarvi TaxID=400777 RepID=A0A3B0CHD0_9BACL|nr:hypothetical protein [Paenibacillus ginsengarvi]RKN84064.1 hypothetical protein D7M11_15965 [Paenibacillus ginsengarvi]